MSRHVSVVLLALIAGLGLHHQQVQFVRANSAFNVGFLGGLESGNAKQGGFLTSTFGNTMDLAQGIPGLLNNAVQQVAKPLDGLVGSVLNPVGSTLSGLSSLTGGITGQIGAGLSLSSPEGSSSTSQLGRAASSSLNSLSLPTGMLGGLTTGLAAATGLNSVTDAATAASRSLANPGNLAAALTGSSVGAISGAARNVGAMSGAAQAAGAISGAAQTVGAMSALSGSASNLMNRAAAAGAASAAAAGSAMNNLQARQAVMNQVSGGSSNLNSMGAGSANFNFMNGGQQNIQNSLASSTAAAAAAAAADSMSSQNSMSAMNSLNQLSNQNSLNSMSHMNQMNMRNMAQYNHMHQRREAIASAAGSLGASSSSAINNLANSIAQSELPTSGAAEAASLAAESAAGLASGLGYAGLGSTGVGYPGPGHPGLGSAALSMGQALESSGLSTGSVLRAADATGALGSLASRALYGSDSQLLGANTLGYSRLPSVAGVGQEANVMQHIGNEAAALGQAEAAVSNSLAEANQVATGALAANQLIHGAAHQSGMAANRAIAKAAIDSTARSLGASQALEAAALPLASAGNGAQLAQVSGALAAETALTEPQVENPLSPMRQNLAADAHANAQAEAAIAGSDMVAHGLENSQSASLATNAYRQAKLASARDRVNIAGTIQNSARISDAAIATHDAATKAEDSLLGSELAVDSAATVLDSDAAYIPPVTNSMLRSLPYGRLGLRNIIPKPLTYPSVLLPDVWLNGLPVNYRNLPFRMMPYGIGAEGAAAAAQASVYGLNRVGGAALTGINMAGAAAAGVNAATSAGLLLEGQPIISNNGIYLNGLLVDPKYAYLRTSNVDGSSIVPILANGQLEAQDEVAMTNLLTAQQQLGPGMLGTYNGFGRMNTVPLLTGSVSDANLAPTTTVGTTYPIGSALVIEPRDSYFQDYIDNASSRQNFDERQQ